VFRILEGHHRQEQRAFSAFRSHYLFESHYCTPAQGHEKGGVESDVGYAQRNFFAPIPKAKDFAELNAVLHQACLNDMQRSVRGENRTVAEVWQSEKSSLLPLEGHDFRACSNHLATVNPYSQVVFETNRYSVPSKYVGQQLPLRAYPFRVEVLSAAEVIAEHPRCFDREQDILNPLHYLGWNSVLAPSSTRSRCGSGGKNGRPNMRKCSICYEKPSPTAAVYANSSLF
jgi:hypothetical protein